MTRPRCRHCNSEFAQKPGGGFYTTPFNSPSGPVFVHKCCLPHAEAQHKTPHIFPAVEVRSETYR